MNMADTPVPEIADRLALEASLVCGGDVSDTVRACRVAGQSVTTATIIENQNEM